MLSSLSLWSQWSTQYVQSYDSQIYSDSFRNGSLWPQSTFKSSCLLNRERLLRRVTLDTGRLSVEVCDIRLNTSKPFWSITSRRTTEIYIKVGSMVKRGRKKLTEWEWDQTRTFTGFHFNVRDGLHSIINLDWRVISLGRLPRRYRLIDVKRYRNYSVTVKSCFIRSFKCEVWDFQTKEKY